MCNRARCFYLVLLLLGLRPAGAGADEDARARAALHFRSANELHDRGDYEGALELYRKARSLFPSYKIDFNIAASLQAMGRLTDAADQLERFLEVARDRAEPSMLEAASRRLAALRRRLGSIQVDCPLPGAVVSANGVELGKTPLRRTYLVPGSYRIAVGATGHLDAEARVRLAPGDHHLLRLSPRRRPAPVAVVVTPPRAEPRRRVVESQPIYRRWWFWTLIGAAVAGGAVAGILVTRGGSDRLPTGELGAMP